LIYYFSCFLDFESAVVHPILCIGLAAASCLVNFARALPFIQLGNFSRDELHCSSVDSFSAANQKGIPVVEEFMISCVDLSLI
jgi:hypothetical protein